MDVYDRFRYTNEFVLIFIYNYSNDFEYVFRNRNLLMHASFRSFIIPMY